MKNQRKSCYRFSCESEACEVKFCSLKKLEEHMKVHESNKNNHEQVVPNSFNHDSENIGGQVSEEQFSNNADNTEHEVPSDKDGEHLQCEGEHEDYALIDHTRNSPVNLEETVSIDKDFEDL